MAIQLNNFDGFSSFKVPTDALEKAVKPLLEIDAKSRIFSDYMEDISSLANESMKNVMIATEQHNRAMGKHFNSIENIVANVQKQMAEISNAQKNIMKDFNVATEIASLRNIDSIAEYFSAQNQELYSTIQAALSVLNDLQVRVPNSVIDQLNSELNYDDLDVDSLEYQSLREINLNNLKWSFVLSVVIFLLRVVFNSYDSQNLKLSMENNHSKLSPKVERLQSQINKKTSPIYSLHLIKIITTKVTLRDKPSLESTSLIELSENELVQTIEANNDWIKVVYWDEEHATVQQGWVQGKYCKPFYTKISD